MRGLKVKSECRPCFYTLSNHSWKKFNLDFFFFLLTKSIALSSRQFILPWSLFSFLFFLWSRTSMYYVYWKCYLTLDVPISYCLKSLKLFSFLFFAFLNYRDIMLVLMLREHAIRSDVTIYIRSAVQNRHRWSGTTFCYYQWRFTVTNLT